MGYHEVTNAVLLPTVLFPRVVFSSINRYRVKPETMSTLYQNIEIQSD